MDLRSLFRVFTWCLSHPWISSSSHMSPPICKGSCHIPEFLEEKSVYAIQDYSFLSLIRLTAGKGLCGAPFLRIGFLFSSQGPHLHTFIKAKTAPSAELGLSPSKPGPFFLEITKVQSMMVLQQPSRAKNRMGLCLNPSASEGPSPIVTLKIFIMTLVKAWVFSLCISGAVSINLRSLQSLCLFFMY